MDIPPVTAENQIELGNGAMSDIEEHNPTVILQNDVLQKMRESSLAVQRVIAGKPKEELAELNNLILTYYDGVIKPALEGMTAEDKHKFYNDVFKAVIAK